MFYNYIWKYNFFLWWEILFGIIDPMRSYSVEKNTRVSQMRELLAGCRELARVIVLMVLYVFEHIMQHLLIHVPYTRIMVFWHINNIPPEIS